MRVEDMVELKYCIYSGVKFCRNLLEGITSLHVVGLTTSDRWRRRGNRLSKNIQTLTFIDQVDILNARVRCQDRIHCGLKAGSQGFDCVAARNHVDDVSAVGIHNCTGQKQRLTRIDQATTSHFRICQPERRNCGPTAIGDLQQGVATDNSHTCTASSGKGSCGCRKAG